MRLLLFVFILLCVPGFAQEQRFDLDDKVDQHELWDFLSHKKVVVIGELHGTNEVPAFVLQVIKSMAAKKEALTVGVEINRSMQPMMDDFMSTGDPDKFTRHDYFKTHDGRTSEAMGRLFIEMRKIRGIRVVCFDSDKPTTSPYERDSLMGVNLAKLFATEKMVILTGNLHASLQKGFWKPDFGSAVYHFNRIRNFGSGMISLNAYMGSGTIWNCGQDGCGEHAAYSDPGIEKRGLKRFVSINNNDGGAYTGYVYFEKVSASLPLRR